LRIPANPPVHYLVGTPKGRLSKLELPAQPPPKITTTQAETATPM
jgi:hypothetical protein